MHRHSSILMLLPCALSLACNAAWAETEATRVVAADPPACSASYSVVGVVYGGDETESINQVVFTDSSPFECTLTGPSQTVTFNLGQDATDGTTGCEYQLVRRLKDGGATLGTSEALSCSNATLHYGVTAVPRPTDPDCSGLGPIDVDPQILLKTNNCGQ